MTNNDIPLCITLGDPLGIGPEITARTLNFLQKKKINLSFIVIGSKKAFYKACETFSVDPVLVSKLFCPLDPARIAPESPVMPL